MNTPNLNDLIAPIFEKAGWSQEIYPGYVYWSKRSRPAIIVYNDAATIEVRRDPLILSATDPELFEKLGVWIE